MKKYLLIITALFCIAVLVPAQKRPLDQNSYDGWKSLGATIISDDGRWVSYTITPQQGDGWLYFFDIKSQKKDSIARGSKLLFSPGAGYAAYQIAPSYNAVRQAKKKKLKEDKMPKNSLGIRLLPGGETTVVGRIKSFSLPEKNSQWMAYLLEKEEAVKKNGADSLKKEITAADSKTKKPEAKGTELVILNPKVQKEYRYKDVTDFSVAADGGSIAFIQTVTDTLKTDNNTINVFNTLKESVTTIFEGKGSARKLSCNKQGSLVAFIYSADTSKVKVYDLWLSGDSGRSLKIVDSASTAMPSGWSVSENASITFSDDRKRIFFGTAPKPVKEPEDTLLDEEKYKLDIWSWDDDVLQPMQKKQLDQEKKKSWQAEYLTDKNRMIQLADTMIPVVRIKPKSSGSLVLGISDLPYRRQSSWDGGGSSDFYLVNLETGSKTKILTGNSSAVYLSPDNRFVIYWDTKLQKWLSLNTSGGQAVNITSGINVPLADELNDVPDDPSPHGFEGWTDDMRHALVYDRYDIWLVDASGKDLPVNLTNGYGRKENLRFRYQKLDPDAETINMKDPLYLSSFNYISKEAGYYLLNSGRIENPVSMIAGKASFPGELKKAKSAGILLWQKGSYLQSPELYAGGMKFENQQRLSVTNPQQSGYNWGTAELVEWTSFDNQKLQGILYKPENFDPSVKYPMIVYFYERSSDGLYSYMPPAPSASIINRTFAASNGYLVFVPDIPYKIGYPGESCYNSVVSGTNALLDRFPFIDRERLALDGQSWGGYQIAWLVTRTDMFRCAYAGAAVSNMISAYGGIRWGTGMSRMFQYEKTQSRIGGTLWEKPLNFVENSPIFFVPKINTPLLLMHNDADDAVPWYQSIEFITALRRLGKPAWLLTYNDEAHNLVKRPNRKDISIRKMQFFDHYLKDAPMPSWMKNGISQMQKGKTDGYELVED